jgi:hypothetical protein
MTTIRTTCPTCGLVDMPADEISLRMDEDGERGAYAFTCPTCLTEVDKTASRKTMALLIAAGVEPVKTSEEREHLSTSLALPLEDRSPDPDASPLTLDDVIAFHFLLEDEAALDEALSVDR